MNDKHLLVYFLSGHTFAKIEVKNEQRHKEGNFIDESWLT